MYGQLDVSHDTDIRVGGNRSINAVGALVHTTAGTDSLGWLQGTSADAGNPASADALIIRDGTRYWLSGAGRFAYHAGISQITYKNRVYRNNQVSQLLMGVELESRVNELITREQYFSLAELLNARSIALGWAGDYPIYGHYAVARPMGRRSDPTNFDWGVLCALLR